MGFNYLGEERGLRHEWTFRYTGAELAPRARAKATQLLAEERGIEQAVHNCQAGGEYSGWEDDLSRLHERLRAKGEERERCELLARELARAAGELFELQVGDLVYFELDAEITDPSVRSGASGR